METIWVLGDQLNRGLGPLRTADPGTARVLMVESSGKLASKPWHRQRAHLVICAMRRFAAELTTEGFEVDYRHSPSLADGLRAHQAEHAPSRVVAMEPASFDGLTLLGRLGVDVVGPTSSCATTTSSPHGWPPGARRRWRTSTDGSAPGSAT